MSTTIVKKENISILIEDLKEEVGRLRSVIIGIVGKDEEGQYRPEFVKKILKSAQEPSHYTFKGKEFFLSQLKNL